MGVGERRGSERSSLLHSSDTGVGFGSDLNPGLFKISFEAKPWILVSLP